VAVVSVAAAGAEAVKQSAPMQAARDPSASVPQAPDAGTYEICWHVLLPDGPKQASP